jgi:hypothetical protein
MSDSANGMSPSQIRNDSIAKKEIGRFLDPSPWLTILRPHNRNRMRCVIYPREETERPAPNETAGQLRNHDIIRAPSLYQKYLAGLLVLLLLLDGRLRHVLALLPLNLAPG